VANPLITTLGSWSADAVSVAEVERALSDLRRHEQQAAVRTGVLTLGCVVPDQATADQALATIHELGPRRPARTLVVITDDGDGEQRIDATASVQVVEIDSRAVCHELVVLRVRGPARFHVDSIIRPLTLPDLPVFIWMPVQVPTLGDPMLGICDRLLVDTRAVTSPERALAQVVKLLRLVPVTDLSWLRLAPWRQQLSGLFQGQVNEPFLKGVDHVHVAGHFAPSRLMAGWVCSRLGLAPEAVTLEDATHMSIRLTATSGASHGQFTVRRPADERALVAEVELESGPSWTQTLRMRDRWPARALADALTRTGDDDVYREALVTGMKLAP
jgi:glucose-6-phosphate dehydrogenase assembly protein OpcA